MSSSRLLRFEMKSPDYIAKIKQLYQRHNNYRKVGRILGLSDTAIRYACKNDYGRVKKKRGPRFLIPEQKHGRIKAVVKRLGEQKEKVTAEKIKNTLDLEVSVRTVCRAMSKLGLTHKNAPQKLPLQEHHKKIRVEMARDWIATGTFNQNVVWTDEKRFSMDGPDNWLTWFDPFDPP